MKILEKAKNYINKIKKGESFKLVVPSSNLAPFAFHFDDHTIASKNGNLIQTIKVTGFSNFSIQDTEKLDIRKKIRNAINQHSKDNNISFWFHTIRTKKNIDSNDEFDSLLADAIHQKWSKKNHLKEKFVNEIYISLIYESLSGFESQKNDIMNYISFDHVKAKQLDHLKNSAQILFNIIKNISAELSAFNPEILGIKYNNNKVTSSLLSFFNQIVNLNQSAVSLPIVDLSEYMINYKVAFGNNAFEIAGKSSKYFGAILTIKEYHEIHAKHIDKILSIQDQIIVTETFTATEKKSVRESYEYQSEVLDLSLDKDIKDISGLSKIFEHDISCFGESQISIMISSTSLQKLNEQVKKCTKTLGEIGLIAYREDINLEDVFWSQLPGNFRFIKRKHYSNVNEIAGLLSFSNYPAGSSKNPWGSEVSIFRSINGTPYFFNFHDDSANGNCLIYSGQDDFSLQILNFLLSESSRYTKTNIIYLSSTPDSIYFAKSIQSAIASNYDELLMMIDKNHISYFSLDNISEEQFDNFINNFISKIKSSENSLSYMLVLDTPQYKIKNIDTITYDLKNYNNSILVLRSSYDYIASYENKISTLFGTQIFTKFTHFEDKHREKINLNPNFYQFISNLDNIQRQFLVIQGKDSIVLEHNISGMSNLISFLSCKYNDEMKANIEAFFKEQTEANINKIIEKL